MGCAASPGPDTVGGVGRKRTPGGVLAALALALPATALAGSVTHSSSAITYQADANASGRESLGVGIESGRAFLRSEQGFSSVPSECGRDGDMFIACDPSAGW